ncbi:3-deoxy-7-phosphoheptulonate synthase [Sphagnurus paluster]|uniref:3-deoxy-7-phosphoheptulonate synthase n=1 Tax=Sphagnurus paluster TaxID=117069 RepID=A0A9P7FVD0_9AGAR|nr:3-deoxy-7-phosphoheptulonate synthase [Sphagnurus paluster]
MSWGAIGARTTESQLHRELASGTSFPIGFKNGTDGSVSVAIDAMSSASNPHAFMGVTDTGLAAIVKTRGNKDVHVILRGGTKGPNYSSEHVKAAAQVIIKKRSAPGIEGWASIMVDCSHGNSSKNHNNQPLVVRDICAQLAAGERHITGVMIESHINAGRQDVPEAGPQELKWGVSITDACVDWETTVGMLEELNEAVAARRKVVLEASFSRPAAFERLHAEEAAPAPEPASS